MAIMGKCAEKHSKILSVASMRIILTSERIPVTILELLKGNGRPNVYGNDDVALDVTRQSSRNSGFRIHSGRNQSKKDHFPTSHLLETGIHTSPVPREE